MKALMVTILLLFPGLASAASDCRVVEYQDRYVATCDGEPQHPSGITRSVATQDAAESPVATVALRPSAGSMPQRSGRQGRPPAEELDQARAGRMRLISQQQEKDQQ
jgi:hypothetical protein